MKKIIYLSLITGISILHSGKYTGYGDSFEPYRRDSNDSDPEDLIRRRNDTIDYSPGFKSHLDWDRSDTSHHSNTVQQPTSPEVATIEVIPFEDLTAPLSKEERDDFLKAIQFHQPTQKLPHLEISTLNSAERKLYRELVIKFTLFPDYKITVDDLKELTFYEKDRIETVIARARLIAKLQNYFMKGLNEKSKIEILVALAKKENENLPINKYLRQLRFLIEVQKIMSKEKERGIDRTKTPLSRREVQVALKGIESRKASGKTLDQVREDLIDELINKNGNPEDLYHQWILTNGV